MSIKTKENKATFAKRIIPMLAMCCILFCCTEDYVGEGGSAVVTVVNASHYEVTNIILTYDVSGDYPRLASLMPGESHEFSITWKRGFGASLGHHIEYYIGGNLFSTESEVGAEQHGEGNVWYSPVQVERDSRVTITIYDNSYEIAGGVKYSYF